MILDNRQYIQTILPLRLEWEPWYYTDCNVGIGSRIRVKFAGREYVAVVSALADNPQISPEKVQPAIGLAQGLEPISEAELKLWRFIAEYYLCTVGEVYKTAYPAAKQNVEARKARKKAQTRLDGTVIESEISFEKNKPLLVKGTRRDSIYKPLISKVLKQGRDVLFLKPDAPAHSYTELRDIAAEVRRSDSPAQLIIGRKQLLFLPYSKLGLIIVDEEQDPGYKQSSPAPRYNGRDVAIMLAGIHDAAVVLGSSCPSLESVQNAQSGKFKMIETGQGPQREPEFIDTTAEKRKRGMDGNFSFKLKEAMKEALDAKEHILLLQPWSDTRDAEIEARALFPQARTRLKLSSLSKADNMEKYGLVALLNADFLFTRQDFRSDERALQKLTRLQQECPCRLIIQGSEIESRMADLNVGRLLRERKDFNLPPFSRMVEVVVSDSNEARRAKMTGILSKEFGSLQIFLPKNRSLAAAKTELASRLAGIEAAYKYTGHIHLDVDPL